MTVSVWRERRGYVREGGAAGDPGGGPVSAPRRGVSTLNVFPKGFYVGTGGKKYQGFILKIVLASVAS